MPLPPVKIVLYGCHCGSNEKTDRIEAGTLAEASEGLRSLLTAGYEYVSVSNDEALAWHRGELGNLYDVAQAALE